MVMITVSVLESPSVDDDDGDHDDHDEEMEKGDDGDVDVHLEGLVGLVPVLLHLRSPDKTLFILSLWHSSL